jgi:hypothetical protein
MAKKQLAFCGIILLAVICATILLKQFYSPEPYNDMGLNVIKSAKDNERTRDRDVLARNLMVGASTLLLLGCMCLILYRKNKNGSQIDLLASKNNTVSASFRDSMVALLVILFGLLFPILLAVFFGFSHFW